MAHQPIWRPDPHEPSRTSDDRTAYDTIAPGPEWTEGNSGLYLAELAATLASHGGGDASGDLALDLVLNEIVEQARLATTASGAAIALIRDDQMVCRATTGENAPDLGVRLNTYSGLSGACVQLREVQCCDDTEIDPRVDSRACRSLDVRSILVVPILDADALVGVFEIFSSRRAAFGERDIKTLEALSRRVVESMHAPKQAATPAAEAPSFVEETVAADVETAEPSENSHAIVEPAVAAEAQGPDYWSTILTVLIVALALLLGWMVGRAGWQSAMGTNKVRRTVTPPAQPPAQEARKEPAPVPANPPAETVKPDPKPEPSAATTSKPKPDSATSGGLAVYENGKLVFQMQPKKPATEPSQPASKPQPSLASDVVSLPPDTASSYLLKRVEPEYPEDARRDRVEGPVVMNVIVSKDGNVRSLSVESGDGRLSQAASDAVRQWRFKPLHRAGAPVEFETRVTVNFTLP